MKIDEEELNKIFIEIKKGNNTAFEKLYNKYNKLVEGVAFSILKNRQDAEDITQSVFTKIYEIDRNKLPSIKEASWLYTTTKNETLTFLRKRNNNLTLDNIYDIEDTNNEINKIINKDSYNRLIGKLNNKEKEIISLKILANLSFDEISKVLNEPTGTIKWRYYKSINSIKILIANLAMLVVTLTIGIRAMFQNKNTDIAKIEILDKEISNESNSSSETEISIKENYSQSSSSSSDNTNLKEQNNTMLDIETNNTTYEQEVISNSSIQNEEKPMINNVEIRILSISFLILIILTIFLLKNQLKKKKKTSK